MKQPGLVYNHAVGGYMLVYEDGLNILVGRVDIDDDQQQLTVSINTEDMDPNGLDHFSGEPMMQVLLNDATLYDVEPAGPDGPKVNVDSADTILRRLRRIHKDSQGKGDQGAFNVWNEVTQILGIRYEDA